MAGNIKGIIVEIGGDTSGLQKALGKVNSVTSNLSKELRSVNSLLKLDPKNTELLEQKQKLLNESIETTQDKLKQLQKIKDEADKKMAQGTEINEENYRALQREIIKTEKNLSSLKNGLEKINSENSNWVKASKKVEEFGNKVDEVSDKINKFGNKASVVTAGVVGVGTLITTTAGTLETAVDKYIATTNTAILETEKYKSLIKEISEDNFGDGYEDIASAMSAVTMQIKDLNDSDLKNITEQAIALRDLFGYDVNESIRAVKALMDNFNISAEDAFDLIAQGKKQGLDFSNELLDNVNEYSVQFNKLGLSAQDMFNIFKVGAENGAFNLDKIGDAVKEFSIRAIDGSNTTIDGFQRIGLNADEMAKKFANGGEEAKQAFVEVVNRLGNMDDKVSQSIAGVDLFGTMWEDLGPTVVTSFSKMDSGIKQSSDTMQESIDTLYNSTQKRAEKTIKKITNLGSKLGDKLLPVIDDLIDKAIEFVDGLEDMSDEELENIINIGLMVAAAGPLIKILGTVGKGVSSATKAVNILTQAIGVSTGKITSNSKAVNALSKGLNGLVSPLGLAAASVGYLTLCYNLATKEYKNQTEEIQKLTESIDSEISSRTNAIKIANENMNANLNEISNIQRLKDELNKLVDENGKVKDGYQARVDFILNELNNALGTEYSRNEDIINSYKELQKNVDELIAKKRAQIVLEADEEKYKEAIKNKNDAYETYLDIQDKIIAKEKEIANFEKMHKYAMDISDMSNYEDLQKQLEDLNASLKNSQNEINEYNNSITRYEKNSELIIEGGLDNYKKVYNSIVETETNTTAVQANEMTKRITNLQKTIAKNTELYNLEAKNNKSAKDNIYQTNLSESQKNLQIIIDELIAMTNTTNELSPDVIEAWNILAKNSRAEYNAAISKMPEDMQDKINNITGIVRNDVSVKEAVRFLGDEAVKEVQKKDAFKEAGKDWLRGINEGINDKLLRQQALSSMYGFGVEGLNAIRQQAWDEHSPSKETEKAAENLLKGIPIGLKKVEPNVLKETEQVAKRILEKFDNFDTNNFNTTGLQKELTKQVNAIIKNKTIVPNVTINTQHLDTNELDRIVTYVNKKFGQKY